MAKQSQEFAARQHQRDLLYAGLGLLSPDAIAQTFGAFRSQLGGPLSAIIGQQDLAGQASGRSVIANLARSGLGNTGLGAALSGALQRGSSFQGSTLRSKLLTDLFAQALNIQSQKAAGFLGASASTPISFGNSNNQAAAQALQAFAASYQPPQGY